MAYIARAIKKKADFIPPFIPWLAIGILFAFAWFAAPQFLSLEHLMNIMRKASGLMIIAAGQTFVIVAAGIDISVGAMITFVDVIAAILLNGKDRFIVLVILLCLGTGTAVGALNGFLSTRLKVPSLIGTLGMAGILRGLSYFITNGSPRGYIPPSLIAIGSGSVGSIPVVLFFAFAVLVALYALLHQTWVGRCVYAVGSNARAAELSGIRPDRVIIFVFALSGFLASLTGLLVAGYISVGSLSIGDGYDLGSIAAVILGGALFSGGTGGIVGSIGGALFLTLLISFMRFFGLSASVQQITQGGILIAAIISQALFTRKDTTV